MPVGGQRRHRSAPWACAGLLCAVCRNGWPARAGASPRFDYRGQGDSLALLPHGTLRGYRRHLFDWTRDYEAAIDLPHKRCRACRCTCWGHSLGAQLPGLFERNQHISGLLAVAAGSGYWRQNAPQLKRIVPYFWFGMVPLADAAVRLLSPAGAWARGRPAGRRDPQWRKWCLNPRYSVGAEGPAARQGYAAVRFPIRRCRSPTTR
jgi:predicted alpha/beta hydrolase